MIGEIRDLETAEISIQSSLTGHLVLSTVHTNDSISAITRLKDMGVESYLLASTIKGVLAQRLVRRLCTKCKEPHSLDTTVSTLSKDTKVFKSKGCNSCNQTGYSGRVGLFELFLMNNEIKEAINIESTEEKLVKLAFQKSRRLSEAGLELVKKGITSLDEVLRVTSED